MKFRIKRIKDLDGVPANIVGSFGLFNGDDLVLVDESIYEVFFYFVCIGRSDECFLNVFDELDFFDLANFIEGFDRGLCLSGLSRWQVELCFTSCVRGVFSGYFRERAKC
jgi:hypothetical protein